MELDFAVFCVILLLFVIIIIYFFFSGLGINEFVKQTMKSFESNEIYTFYIFLNFK